MNINKKSLGMLVALATEYILGMYINMFALPPEDPGFATESVVPKIAFGLHGLMGCVLLIGGLLVLFAGLKSAEKKIRDTSLHGFLSILLAFLAGIATISFKDEASEIASFLMSVGFLMSFFFYGKLVYETSKNR